jgi:hypothetical protein
VPRWRPLHHKRVLTAAAAAESSEADVQLMDAVEQQQRAVQKRYICVPRPCDRVDMTALDMIRSA